MKRFNIDELIWFIILTLLSICMIFLIKSGSIANFIDADMIKYFYISIAIVIIFAIVQFSRIFTIKRRKDITHKFVPITFTLCIGVMLLYIFPLIKSSAYVDNKYVINYSDNAIIISSENYNLLDEINYNKEEYLGKEILFLGYVDKNSTLEDLILCREAISCCQSDKEKLEVKVNGITEIVQSGQWINVYGKIYFENDDFYIETIDYVIENEPIDIYFHEQL